MTVVKPKSTRVPGASAILKTDMRVLKQTLRTGSSPFRLAVGASLVLFLLTVSLAASSTFHRFLHKDADSRQHQCAVTLLTQGQVETPVFDARVVVPEARIELSRLASILIPRVAAEILPPGRAPPSLA